jgi:hypothetical protein
MTMALDTTFASLEQEMGRLCDALGSLRMTVIEDRPLEEGTLLVDSLGDLAEELLATAREALSWAREAAAPPEEGEALGAALFACQESYQRLQRRFATELTSYERVAEIVRLGRARGGEWKAWAGSVRAGAEACRPPLDNAGEALFACWRELSSPPPRAHHRFPARCSQQGE